MPNTIEWSEEEMRLLINLRRDRNEDYWRRFGRSKVPFWNEIAAKIEEDLGTRFTGVQVREKFKGMVKDCKVSKYILKKKNENNYIYLILILVISKICWWNTWRKLDACWWSFRGAVWNTILVKTWLV